MVSHDDIGRTVTCSQGLGTLERVRCTVGMHLAVVKLRTGGYTVEDVRKVTLYEEVPRGHSDSV